MAHDVAHHNVVDVAFGLTPLFFLGGQTNNGTSCGIRGGLPEKNIQQPNDVAHHGPLSGPDNLYWHGSQVPCRAQKFFFGELLGYLVQSEVPFLLLGILSGYQHWD